MAKSAAQRKKEERIRDALGQRIERVVVGPGEQVLVVPEQIVLALLTGGQLREIDLNDPKKVLAAIAKAVLNFVSHVTSQSDRSGPLSIHASLDANNLESTRERKGKIS